MHSPWKKESNSSIQWIILIIFCLFVVKALHLYIDGVIPKYEPTKYFSDDSASQKAEQVTKADLLNDTSNQFVEIEKVTDTGIKTKVLYSPDGTIDTSNWKAYTNEEYGFSVRHPGDWNVDDQKITSDYNGNISLLYITPRSVEKQQRDSVGVDLGFSVALQESKSEEFFMKYYPGFSTVDIGAERFRSVTTNERMVFDSLVNEGKCLFDGENGPSGFGLTSDRSDTILVGVRCISTADIHMQRQMKHVLESFIVID